MARLPYLIVFILLFAACSSPKYTYNFDYYDYNSGRKNASAKAELVGKESPLTIDQTTMVASERADVLYDERTSFLTSKTEKLTKLKSLSRDEKQQLRAAVKAHLKDSKKLNSSKEVKEAKYMEEDLKLAAILGAVGLVLLIIGTDILTVLGALALLGGLFFLIRYLVNQ